MDLYGGKNPGKGRWLYGAQLDWDELAQPAHREMFQDVKKMIAIRRQHADVLAMSPGSTEPNLSAVSYHADFEAPAPYIRWKNNRAILIAGNRSSERDAEITVRFPDEALRQNERFNLQDLWSGTATKECRREELQQFRFTVKRDKIAGGGLAVYAITPIA